LELLNMSVNTPGLPSAWRSPGTYIANVPNGGGGGVGLLPTMIVGQMLTSGTAVPNVPVSVFSQFDCGFLFGAESMLAAMYAAYRLNDPNGYCMVTPVSDNVGGQQASWLMTLTGTATSAGTLAVYVNNQAASVGVSIGDTAAVVAGNLVTAIASLASNPNTVLGVTASNTLGVVTITGIHKGITAGDVQLSVGKGGEFLPTGIGVPSMVYTAGTGDPDLTAAILAITPLSWSFLVCPYTTSTVNTAINTLLSDTVGRWSPVQQNYGIRFAAIRGSLTTQVTYGGSVGSNKHMTTLGILDSQTPIPNASAIFGGLSAMTSRSNVALPIVGELQGLDAPSLLSRLTRAQENVLLYSGVSPIRVDLSGNATLPRAVQEYQSNSNYLNVETDLMVEYVDMFIRSDLESVYKQVSLLADGNPVAAGSGAVTPSLILAHVWGLYLDLEALGVVQNAQQFIATSYVEANIAQGVVSLYLPVVTSGLLRVIRIQNSFS
jgi:phage tail sheath gpL-like